VFGEKIRLYAHSHHHGVDICLFGQAQVPFKGMPMHRDRGPGARLPVASRRTGFVRLQMTNEVAVCSVFSPASQPLHGRCGRPASPVHNFRFRSSTPAGTIVSGFRSKGRRRIHIGGCQPRPPANRKPRLRRPSPRSKSSIFPARNPFSHRDFDCGRHSAGGQTDAFGSRAGGSPAAKSDRWQHTGIVLPKVTSASATVDINRWTRYPEYRYLRIPVQILDASGFFKHT